MHQEIVELIRLIEVTPKNEALIDRLKEARYPQLWLASTVDSMISYAIHAQRGMEWNAVGSILSTVLENMEIAELHEAAKLSREHMRWIDATDRRAELHQMVLDVASVTTV